jgi:hypothetical protein
MVSPRDEPARWSGRISRGLAAIRAGEGHVLGAEPDVERVTLGDFERSPSTVTVPAPPRLITPSSRRARKKGVPGRRDAGSSVSGFTAVVASRRRRSCGRNGCRSGRPRRHEDALDQEVLAQGRRCL